MADNEMVLESLNDDTLAGLEIEEIEDRYEMQVLGAGVFSPSPDACNDWKVN